MLLPTYSTTSAATVLLTVILKEYFQNFYCVLQFSDDSRVRMAGKNGIYILSGNTILTANDIHKYNLCLGIVIKFGPDPQRVFEMYEYIIRKYTRARFQERRYVILFNTKQQDAFARFSNSVSLKFVSDVLILREIPDGNGSFCLYTNQFVGVNNNEKLVLLDEWNFQTETFKFNADLYPDKMRNLQGKKLIVGGNKYLPIADPENLKGPEVRLLVEYTQKHNVTLVFDQSFDYLGKMEKNWTGTGFMKKLLDDDIDIIAYAVYSTYTRMIFGDFTRPMSEIRVTCLVPKPEELNHWILMNIYENGVWFLISVHTTTVTIVFMFFRKFHIYIGRHTEAKIYNHFSNSRMMLSQPSNRMPKTGIGRSFVGFLLCTQIIICIFFTTKLASFLTVPGYVDNIQTLRDLANSDLLWYAKSEDKNEIIRHDKNELLMKISTKFRFLQDDFATIKDKKFAFAIDESFVSRLYYIDDYFTLEKLRKFKVMREYMIRQQYTALFLRRNSVWLNGINAMCFKVMEHGLIKYWEKESVTDSNERRIQKYLILSRRKSDIMTFVPLKFQNIILSIIYLVAGWCGALIVFILEYYKFRLCRLC